MYICMYRAVGGERWCIEDAVAGKILRMADRMGWNIDPEESWFVCQECGRVHMTNEGLISQCFSHVGTALINYEAFFGNDQLACE